MKKDMILHTIAKLGVPIKRAMSSLQGHWASPSSALRTMLMLMMTLGVNGAWGQTDITSLSEITDPTGNYRLTSDVSGSGHTSIATFSGTLEAQIDPNTKMPYRITGLSAPLFTTLTGTVKNLVLEDVSISGNNGNTGAIACTANGTANGARIYNVGILSGSVGGTGNTGGLVGLLGDKARVVNCYSFATITSGSNVGGIVGNNNATTTAGNINTMVMNCMFYGDITGGTTVSPVYGGTNINNLNSGGLNTFNYYAYDELKTKAITNNKYNCALAVEEKFLNRFEFYRLLLNSNKKLAAFYVTGNVADANQMLKWVLETADRTIANPKPYPILKAQGYYPSIINPDFANAPDSSTVGRNHGGKLPSPRNTLTVNISSAQTTGGQTKPTGATITTSSLTLIRTDKDFDRFNYNYDKVQLPYYNDVGTGNYTGNRVVTGWKITAITAISGDPYTSANYPTTGITDYPNHNYADRRSSNKDLYSVSKRVFSQGAYFDVPYGVTSITIEPYWGKAYYLADPNYDVVYKIDYTNGNKQNVTQTGTQVTVGTTKFNEQDVETSIERALNKITSDLGGLGSTVYDNALVLVGNLHLATVPQNGTNSFTMTSVDMDNDHEPDHSLIYHHIGRSSITPIRFDFLNIPGTAQAQKPNGASLICNFTIFKTRGWFETTNTALFYTSQLEYENLDNNTKTDAPLILLGGVVDQFVSTQNKPVTGKTIYIHVGGNVWIKEFGMGTHSDGSQSTPHVPVSVTGGEFPGFYLTGTYKADATVRTDNAECYISGGYIHEAAGASLEQINGNVRWQIYNADIDNFFGGGINDAKPITGDITTEIYNSHVTLFCGGPKFGNMQTDKNVTTNAEGCTFGRFYGAGYGGTSIAKKKYYDKDGDQNWTTLEGYYTTDRGNYFNGTETELKQGNASYGFKGPGVATDFDYEFFVWSSGKTGGRFFVKFASFSLAQCNDVSSTLKKCTVNENFYGGGNLGKVVGTATSVLEDCMVNGSVYGAGYSASLPTVEVRDAGFTKIPNYNKNSGMFEPAEFSGTTTFTWQNAAEAGVTLTNNQSGSNLENHVLYTNADLTTLGEVANTDLTIKGNTTVAGSVYGGGEESGVDDVTAVNLQGGTISTDVFGGGKEGNVGGSVTVNMEGGTVTGSLYGGGALAETGGTTVNLHNGTIEGDVFGGGLGRLESGTEGEEGYIEPIAAIVNGDVLVELNGTQVTDGDNNTTYPDQCIVNGRIFGCNNLNGTPRGNVTVHIYKTWGTEWTDTDDLDDTDDSKHKYHLEAVYGGGNLAAYKPSGPGNGTEEDDKNTTKFAHVIIDGCDLTSIQTVYGGGNAASTPATQVDVHGTYEIEEVFGGGNGKDALPNGDPNPGANVGFYAYMDDQDDTDTKDERAENYGYGTGEAKVNIYGGRIHRVFGGSNTKGNVRIVAVTMLDNEDNPCDFIVDEAYGGGKSALMDGAANLIMACVPGLKAAYGGAEEANINGDVKLTITNGNFDRVFGGNNMSGTIMGNIEVNIEETGCKPVIIGQLYGGGNQAPYNGPEGEGPTVNVRSFTSIGDIFGGGYGETAVVTGNTTVNVSVTEGKFSTPDAAMKEYLEESLGDRTIEFAEYVTDPNTGEIITETKSVDVSLPTHEDGKIGAINNVYGGGNAAKVDGNTTVNIGTLEYIEMVSVTVGTDVTGYYTRSGEGTSESPYEYTAATGPAAEETTYYKKVTGVDIRGNVYGGGNNAEVTGDTNVFIGLEKAN